MILPKRIADEPIKLKISGLTPLSDPIIFISNKNREPAWYDYDSFC